MTRRFPIRFDLWYRALSTALLIPPSSSYVEIDDKDVVHVRMAWAFSACFPRSAVYSMREEDGWTPGRGAHGFAGRWLVNGSAEGLVALELKPEQKGSVLGVPVKLRRLIVSAEDPIGLMKALRG